MCTDQVAEAVVEALDGLNLGELTQVGAALLQRVTTAAGAAPAAGDHTLGGLLHGVIDSLGAVPLDGVISDAALTDSVVALQRAEARVTGEKLRRIGELAARKAHRGKAMSTGDWLGPKLGLSRGEARAQTEAAQALQRLPKTAERLRRGELGVGQARQAARGLTELDRLADQGADVAPDAASRLDDHAATHGPTSTPAQLRRGLDELAHRHAPDALADRERRAHANRRLWLGPAGPDGTAPLEGRLDVPGRAALAAALDALSRPTGPEDTRTPAQRRHDALVTFAERALDAGDLPTVAAQRPHVIITGPAEAFDEGADPDSDADPALLDGYGPVSSATARMIACDGEVTEIVLDQHGRPLKVIENGRPNRAQRRAVIARDRVCIGCGAPASRCHIHHVRWRRHNGATVVENLVLVCRACHHAIHHDGWVVTWTAEAGYSARPPTASNARGAGAGGTGPPDDLRHTA